MKLIYDAIKFYFPLSLISSKKKKRKTRDSFSNIHNNIALIALEINRYSRLIGSVAITISINKLKTTGERERRKGDPLACMKIFYHNQLLDACSTRSISFSLSFSLITTYYYGDSLPGIVNIILLSYLSDSLPTSTFPFPNHPFNHPPPAGLLPPLPLVAASFILFRMFFHFLKGSPVIISTMRGGINYYPR